MRRARSATGFTMIEMIVTLGVFAIMVALGVPAMRTWTANNKVRAAADNLQNGLRLAQAESLRRSRQVVLAFTNTTTPGTMPVAAAANATAWVIYTLPSYTDGSETPTYIQAGSLSSISTNIIVNTNGVAAVCFNAAGRLIASSSAALTSVTGGATCAIPTGTPPVTAFGFNATGADRNLQVNVALGGQVHMCDPNIPLSAAYPEGCQ